MKAPTPEDIQAVAADSTLWFCWFSKKSWNQMVEINQFLPLLDVDKRRTSIYRSPTGKDLKITSVTHTPEPIQAFEDIEYLGIGHWESCVRIPTK